MYKFYNVISLLILTSIISVNVKAQVSSTSDNYLITDDNIKLYTKESGKGPIAIFIHGGPGAWSKSFEDLGGKNLESLFTMIYYDQRGCGRSQDSKNDDYSLERMLKDIELIRQNYGADSVYLIAHSFGGILAVNYAHQYPTHVKGIVLINSTLNLLYSIRNQIHFMNKLLNTDYKAGDSSQIIPTFKKAQSELVKQGSIYKLLSDNKKNIDLLNKIDEENPGDFAFARNVLSIGDYLKDYTKITNQIEIPTLVVTGTADHAIGENHFQSFAFQKETIKQIDGGHLLYYEKNKELINAVSEFVTNTNR